MKTLPLLASVFIGFVGPADSASTLVNWSTTRMLHGASSGPLSAGGPIDGDGALLQLGYFSMGTLTDPFAGSWTVLALGSVGDQGGLGDGLFSITSILGEGSVVAPAVGTPLGVRFYDGPSISSSTYYNTAVNVDGSGLWLDPADPAPVIELELAKGATEFEDRHGPFQTRILVPEPSVTWFGCFALAWFLFRRKKP